MIIHCNIEGLHASWTLFVLQQQQNLGQRFGTSKIHVSPQPPTPSGLGCCPSSGGGSTVVDCYSRCGSLNCCMLCCTLLYFHYSFATILMGIRERVASLGLSSWCLVMVVWLFLTVPWVCQQFVIVVFPDHTHLLFWTCP